MTEKLMICPKKECWQRFCYHLTEHEYCDQCEFTGGKPEPYCPACIEVEVKDER